MKAKAPSESKGGRRKQLAKIMGRRRKHLAKTKGEAEAASEAVAVSEAPAEYSGSEEIARLQGEVEKLQEEAAAKDAATKAVNTPTHHSPA